MGGGGARLFASVSIVAAAALAVVVAGWLGRVGGVRLWWCWGKGGMGAAAVLRSLQDRLVEAQAAIEDARMCV